MIQRDFYLNQLIERINNDSIKIITGVRRCGKSVLLNDLFYQYLLDKGVDKSHIIKFAFDSRSDLSKIGEDFADVFVYKRKVDPHKFCAYIDSLRTDDGLYYLLLDEVQYLKAFEAVLIDFLYDKNIDVYVTGSNSRFLSTDIVTEFRGRGDEVRVYPLTFKEFYSHRGGDVLQVYKEYSLYGGMPGILKRTTDKSKKQYLKDLFSKVYLSDIANRNNVLFEDELDSIVNFLCSNIGSLTNPKKISDTLRSIKGASISDITAKNYLGYLTDAFLFEKAKRYDIKGKKYFDSICKYYAVDVGLRNAKINFSQNEPNHIMENIVFNELLARGYSVDVGVVKTVEHHKDDFKRKQLEIDFIVDNGGRKYYIQCAYMIPSEDKENQEKRSLQKINNSFKKIILIYGYFAPYADENGIVTMGLMDFLLDENSLDT